MRLYPFQVFIKYLICVGRTPSWIVEHLSSLGFNPPNDDYIKVYITEQCQVITEVHKLMQTTISDDPKIRPEEKDAMIALAEKVGVAGLCVHKLGRGNAEHKEIYSQAIDILRDGHLRDIVEALLLRRVENAAIATILTDNHLGAFVPAAIQVYQEYFWNTELVPRSDWKQYLNELPEGPERYKRLLAIYYHPEYVKYKLGLEAEVAYNDMLKDITSSLYFKFKDMIASDNPDMVLKSVRVAESATRIGEKMQNLLRSTKTGFFDELQNNLQFIEAKIPLLE